jgi:hypothetical protein
MNQNFEQVVDEFISNSPQAWANICSHVQIEAWSAIGLSALLSCTLWSFVVFAHKRRVVNVRKLLEDVKGKPLEGYHVTAAEDLAILPIAALVLAVACSLVGVFRTRDSIADAIRPEVEASRTVIQLHNQAKRNER